MLIESNEALLPEDRIPYFKARAERRNKLTRRNIKKQKLRKLYDSTKTKYGVGAYMDTEKQRLVRYSVNNAGIRTFCNRRFRRRLNGSNYEDIGNGGSYRKHEEYWWSVC